MSEKFEICWEINLKGWGVVLDFCYLGGSLEFQ